ncbi:MAG: hypothetical protein LRZ88_01355 [Candidatus Cloacimonetes bacterium]|nr:hypothetical protein [Candidatus Cloacimonadota bacterium]
MESKLPLSRWQTAIVDENTMYSGMSNIFAGGDFQRGAATAIEAIADGRKAAEAIGTYLLKGELPKPKFIFDAKKARKVKDVSPKEYEIFDKIHRVKMPEIPLEVAKSSFEEVETGFSEFDARTEAARCVECGCQVNESCSLRTYCSEYEIEMDRFLGSISRHPHRLFPIPSSCAMPINASIADAASAPVPRSRARTCWALSIADSRPSWLRSLVNRSPHPAA